MRLRELFEQTISSVPPGQGGVLPPTTPTRGAGQDDTQKKNTANPNQTAQIRGTLNKVKGSLSAAGGGVIDTNKLTTIMSQDTDPNKPMDPVMVKSLQTLLPGIGDALQDPQSADKLTQAIKTGVSAHDKMQQQQKNQQKQQAAVKSQQTGVPVTSV
jgi:hypothetical protein